MQDRLDRHWPLDAIDPLVAPHTSTVVSSDWGKTLPGSRQHDPSMTHRLQNPQMHLYLPAFSRGHQPPFRAPFPFLNRLYIPLPTFQPFLLCALYIAQFFKSNLCAGVR